MACAASPISVTREGVQAGAGYRYPNGITKIEFRSMLSTAQGLAAVGIHVQVVATLAAEVGVALEHLAGVAVLE